MTNYDSDLRRILQTLDVQVATEEMAVKEDEISEQIYAARRLKAKLDAWRHELRELAHTIIAASPQPLNAPPAQSYIDSGSHWDEQPMPMPNIVRNRRVA